ncbi:peptidylprolyl isomerase [Brevifollis gellanilyticus]|uniref:peptidylprolyl isomerase n=1 Tax=Brevifollis gellanilyticus TaxID=748831 RepID=UPI001478EFCD|nr:peptidylprolyl isomerase [Brevifollis gellanilyticus]
MKTRLEEDARLRMQRLTAGSSSDISEEVRDELNFWEEQFHLGDADRAERLALQRLTKSDMRQSIVKDLQDGAFLESRLPPITQEAARGWYERHKEELRIPARHRVHHIFLSRHVPNKPDRSAEIRSIHAELQRGTAFGALAAKRSEDARSKVLGGDLGWISAGRMPEDFMTQVEKLPVGKAGAPVETKLGWHLLLVTERRASRLPSFDEVSEEITALLDFEQRTRFKP